MGEHGREVIAASDRWQGERAARMCIAREGVPQYRRGTCVVLRTTFRLLPTTGLREEATDAHDAEVFEGGSGKLLRISTQGTDAAKGGASSIRRRIPPAGGTGSKSSAAPARGHRYLSSTPNMLPISSLRSLLTALCLLACSGSAFAHLSYSGRNFGTFTGLELQSNTIAGQTVPTNWGWADGTDGDFGHSHRVRFFRFTLENTATVTLTFTSLDPTAMLPAFSLYSGLAHSSPPDYENAITYQYLSTLPGAAKEGAFNALATWKMGNDASQTYDDFSTFSYVGNGADGGSGNYGNTAGINGDGVADGTVTGTFVLPAGSYTVGVGGANYSGQGAGAPTTEGANEGADGTADALTSSIAVVPEPTATLLGLSGVILMALRRRRRRA
jgi:hypothetical protein